MAGILKRFWPYALVLASLAFLHLTDLRPYCPLKGNDILKILSGVFTVTLGSLLIFAYRGLAQPIHPLEKGLLGVVVMGIFAFVFLRASEGWGFLSQGPLSLSKAYAWWAGEILLIFFLPALGVGVVTYYALSAFLQRGRGHKRVEQEPYGSARLSSALELQTKNDKTGFPLGRILNSVEGDDLNLSQKILSSKVGDIFRYTPVHSFLIAPTGAGKGIGFVIPTLLEYDGPVIAMDPKKAENYGVTARYRRQNGTRKIYAFDTGELTGSLPARLNIFDFLDPHHQKYMDQVKYLVSALCPCSGDRREDFFIEAAQDILMCILLSVAKFPPKNRTLLSVYNILMQTDEELGEFFLEVSKDDDPKNASALRLAKKVLSTDKRELSGCMNTARRALRFLESEPYRQSVQETNFDIKEIFENKADLFFCLPTSELRSHGNAFVRLILAVLIQKIKELPKPPSKKVLFLLDEMAGIGRIEAVEDILLEGRGYGIMLMGVAQTLASLKKIYREELETLLSSSVVLFLGARTPEDLTYITRRLGNKTVFTEAESLNKRDSKTQEGHTKSAVKREILTTSEISDLGKEYVIAFIEGFKPAVLKKLNYLTDKAFKGKFDPNKFH